MNVDPMAARGVEFSVRAMVTRIVEAAKEPDEEKRALRVEAVASRSIATLALLMHGEAVRIEEPVEQRFSETPGAPH